MSHALLIFPAKPAGVFPERHGHLLHCLPNGLNSSLQAGTGLELHEEKDVRFYGQMLLLHAPKVGHNQESPGSNAQQFHQDLQKKPLR